MRISAVRCLVPSWAMVSRVWLLRASAFSITSSAGGRVSCSLACHIMFRLWMRAACFCGGVRSSAFMMVICLVFAVFARSLMSSPGWSVIVWVGLLVWAVRVLYSP